MRRFLWTDAHPSSRVHSSARNHPAPKSLRYHAPSGLFLRAPRDPGRRQALARPYSHSPWESQIVVSIPDPAGHILGVLSHDEDLVLISDKIGSGLSETLRTQGLVWANAADADPIAGAGFPAALALSADGTTLQDVVHIQQHRMVGSREADGWSLGEYLPASGSIAPPPRTGFVPIYSRSGRKLFIVGGTDAAGGNTGDLWWRDLLGGDWQQTTLAAPIAEVTAATYSVRDHRVWVLEATSRGQRRLLRIDPVAGSVDEVASWPIRGAYERHWLTLDQDGGVLIAASSTSQQAHAGIRIAVKRREIALEGVWDSSKGALAMAPVVDATGYTTVLVPSRGATPTSPRMDVLPWTPVQGWSELGTWM